MQEMRRPVLGSVKASYDDPEMIGLLTVSKQVSEEFKPLLEATTKRLVLSCGNIDPEILFKVSFESITKPDSPLGTLADHIASIKAITIDVSKVGCIRSNVEHDSYVLRRFRWVRGSKALMHFVTQHSEIEGLEIHWTQQTYEAESKQYSQEVRTADFTREEYMDSK